MRRTFNADTSQNPTGKGRDMPQRDTLGIAQKLVNTAFALAEQTYQQGLDNLRRYGTEFSFDDWGTAFIAACVEASMVKVYNQEGYVHYEGGMRPGLDEGTAAGYTYNDAGRGEIHNAIEKALKPTNKQEEILKLVNWYNAYLRTFLTSQDAQGGPGSAQWIRDPGYEVSRVEFVEGMVYQGVLAAYNQIHGTDYNASSFAPTRSIGRQIWDTFHDWWQQPHEDVGSSGCLGVLLLVGLGVGAAAVTGAWAAIPAGVVAGAVVAKLLG